jgi:hypothetical protein
MEICALIQLWNTANVNVIVAKEPLSDTNCISAGMLPLASRNFHDLVWDFGSSTIIMERDVGVRGESRLTREEREKLRTQQDADRRRQIAALLNEEFGAGTVSIEENDSFHVLAQPTFDDPELYMKSIFDLISILSRVAVRRRVISGRELLDRFHQVSVAAKIAIEAFITNAEDKAACNGAWAAALTAWGLGAGYAWWATSALTFTMIGAVGFGGVAAGGIGYGLYKLVAKISRTIPENDESAEAIKWVKAHLPSESLLRVVQRR